jgi:VIT1/CCC1 family predicted Fe2+/Mn2+ transporter
MSVSSPSAPESSGAREPRHRSTGGEGSTGGGSTFDRRDADAPAPVPAPRRAGGRHRAPDATTSSVGVPLGAVPTQRGTAVPRRRPAYASPRTVHDDDAVTVPVPRAALDRAAWRGPVDQGGHAVDQPGHAAEDRPGHAAEDRPGHAAEDQSGHAADEDAPALRPLSVQRPEAEPRYRPGQRVEPATPPRAEAPSRPAVSRRGVAPWETSPVDEASTRLGLVALVTGALGVLVGLAPWSGLLPRVLPQSALGAIPVFSLVGALLGVVGLGVGALAMFRASEASRGLLVGGLGACLGAAAVVVGLVV